MYVHPADHLAMFHAHADELRQAAAQERLTRRLVRTRRAERQSQWLASFADHLSRAALRPRQA